MMAQGGFPDTIPMPFDLPNVRVIDSFESSRSRSGLWNTVRFKWCAIVGYESDPARIQIYIPPSTLISLSHVLLFERDNIVHS